MRRLYGPYTYPLARIVHGLPNSWDQSIATMKFPSLIDTAIWSPCSRFIAIVWGRSKAMIETLDAVTLGRLATLELPLGQTLGLVFSPDARLLTWFGESPVQFVSWDLQTGSLVSTISPEQQGYTQDCFSATFSECGTMFGVSLRDGHRFTISAYNVRSGTHIYSHSIEGLALDQIWTHGECLRFATLKSGSVTTWEVKFSPADAPTEVQSLSIPGDSYRVGRFLLHPNLSRLAFITGGRVKVWDAQDSKFLLDSADVKWPRRMSFSSDGRFLACGTSGLEFYLWKESPSGYTSHQKLISNTGASKPLISPDGELIIAFGDSAIQLWRTAETTSLSTTPTQASQKDEGNFILGFSPDEALAAITRMGAETVTILELESGTPRLIIDTGMKVHGLGVGGNTIVVVGEGKIVNWNLPAGDRVLGPRTKVNDSIRTTTFNHPSFPTFTPRPTMSVSSDLHRVAIVEERGRTDSCLHLYDVPTGQNIASAPIRSGTSPWFTSGGREVWCVTDSGEAELWGIVGNGGDVTKLEHLGSTTQPPDGFPWRPPRGYDTTGRRWILNSDGKRLLWLPPHWRSDGWDWMLGGRFIALLNRELLEPVILELEV